MKYEIKYSNEFKKGLKKYKHDKQTLELIQSVIDKLANDEILDEKYKDHKLKGDYKDLRECHIKPDLLLIYKKDSQILVLICLAIGSHSDLF
ncbi:type II toxin-antitoxin system YafQ family toxin [Helicobacter jaachi]|uniref:Type II toxin-antitoxin system YafQ family toxin n=1 Tax=Helicobacter jaachi TaxID=1677920 RepID=A0A4U8TDJ8_9HELI|nr:type II toxin-antitoxin system YafQ family toxin [Helicobacter jaachi]TLD97368.1 type II toxin-antitoxin system YafQ family toxin [Helicobacter jaachi]